MSYNTKNYTEQGGEKTVIGGELEIKPDATVIGLPKSEITPGTAVADIATDADAASIVTTVNALLASLRRAGFLAEE